MSLPPITYLPSLCIKLGNISGLNFAEACKAFLPPWLNIFLYVMAEGAIIATDIAEVIGTAIASNLLIPQIPLVAGCAISIVDLSIVIYFYIQLSLIKDNPIREVFRGYLPSSSILESKCLYQACGILGATVMPHSLYLGSGIVQSRLHDFDVRAGHAEEWNVTASQDNYPYLPAIKFCLKYSILEIAIPLFTFALFVNSAIRITAGASLSGSNAEEADLFGIHNLLASSIAPAAGTVSAILIWLVITIMNIANLVLLGKGA